MVGDPNLARRLRNARMECGLSVAQVAQKVGVSRVSVYCWEAGRTMPLDRSLIALYEVLNLPLQPKTRPKPVEKGMKNAPILERELPKLARRLRTARIERGLSIAFVAEQVGVAT